MFASIFLVHPAAQNASAQTTPFIINVGVQDEMKTRNLIRGFFFGTDVWTADALNPVGEGTVQTDPETQTVLPYTMVGTDVNGDGKFEANELGAFSNVTGIPLRASEWIAFFNINGMKWHDCTQVQLEDVLFGYPSASGTNVYLNGVPGAGYDLANPVTFEGITVPAGHLAAFDVTAASVGCPHDVANCAGAWEAQDQDVIGAGSYKFVTWVSGNYVRLDKNPDYFIPDTSVRSKYPTSLVLRVPKVDEIVYRLYRNVQATVYALQAGALDFIDWTVPPDQVGPIAGDPNIGLKSSADAGFFYQSFNFDRLPFGYLNPALGSTGNNDVGRPFRLAVAYATNKRTIVTSLLQNFGAAGHTVVSPTNTLYYNASAPRYEFNPTVAAGILDAASTASLYSSP